MVSVLFEYELKAKCVGEKREIRTVDACVQHYLFILGLVFILSAFTRKAIRLFFLSKNR